jgi:hypothetical protein
MEYFSKIDHCIRLPINIEVFPYLRDHVFGKNAVFPAVESMQLLVKAFHGLHADIDDRLLSHAVFEKFLVLDPQEESIEAWVEFQKIQDGGMIARLVTRRHLAGFGITRVKEHARVIFSPRFNEPKTPNIPNFVELKTDILVSPDRIYRDLVPFGPAYWNITDKVRLNREIAAAVIRAPDQPDANGPLGSPFVLDAAFHAACAWGQRYSGFIGFPVEFNSRIVMQPTKPGEEYLAYLAIVKQHRGENIFNLLIYQSNGIIFEVVDGLKMRDVTGGRMKPPGWIQETSEYPGILQ